MKKRILIILFNVFLLVHTQAQLIMCNGKNYFVNGVNIPWHLYSQDFGTHYQLGNQYDSSWYENAFAQFQAYGINTARFWLHTDGATSPRFNASGYVTGLDTSFYTGLDDVFKRALKHHVMLIPSIWDFNMCNNDSALGIYGGMHASLIQDTSKTRSYINTALIPMVKRYANQCNLLAWEIINEPEWAMNVPFGATTSQKVNASQMQCFVGMQAEAIHQYSTKLVTVGSASLRWNSDVFSVTTPCVANYWKDQAIQAAYNKPLAHLDFYEIHYYDWMNGVINFDPYQSCCTASYWGLDKPCLIGESQGNSTKHTPTTMLYNAFTGNYAGVLFWSYGAGADSMGKFNQFNSALLALRNAASGIIDLDTNTCNRTTGINPRLEAPLVVFPNPANTSLSIQGLREETSCTLYNALGEELLEVQVDQACILNLEKYPAGIYTLSLENSQVRRLMKVIVVK